MATAQAIPSHMAAVKIGADDRLGLTVFFAVVLHSLIILGVSFSQPDKKDPPEKLPGLEVTLVQSKTDKKIEDADFLGQANQEGGGINKELERPTSPKVPEVVTGETGEISEFVPETLIPQQSDPSRMQIMSANRSEEKMKSEQQKQDIPSDETENSSAQLLQMNKQSAQLSAEIEFMQQKNAGRKKTKYLGGKTKQYKWANYEESFRKKIEQVGTLKFPDAARRANLSGNVMASVTIAADGSVVDMEIIKYSGHKILDDAVKRIVKMSAPFKAFPPELSEEYEKIVIVRTWQFLAGDGGRLKTKRVGN